MDKSVSPTPETTSSPARPAVVQPVRPEQLRASHADREAVAQVLNQAMADGRISVAELQDRLDVVYAAKTLGELEPVTEDLPGHLVLVRPTPPAMPATFSAGPLPIARIGGVPDSRTAVAIFSGAERTGQWVVPTEFKAVAVMGGIQLDLTEARFETREVRITAVAIFGGVEVFVDDSIDVRVRGVGVLGGFERPRDLPPAQPGAPVVVIDGLALMGGVEVKRRTSRQLPAK